SVEVSSYPVNPVGHIDLAAAGPLSVHSLRFFTLPAPPDLYTLSLHDALPILWLDILDVLLEHGDELDHHGVVVASHEMAQRAHVDRKSTRLNSSHQIISYAVFCWKKKKHRRRQTSPATIRKEVVAQ